MAALEKEVTIYSPAGEVRDRCQEWLRDGRIAVMWAEVRAVRDYGTGQIIVKGICGMAPDMHTPLLYPVSVYRYGYWNKTQLRVQMSAVKRELLAAMQDAGYTRKMLTRPFEMCEVRL